MTSPISREIGLWRYLETLGVLTKQTIAAETQGNKDQMSKYMKLEMKYALFTNESRVTLGGPDS